MYVSAVIAFTRFYTHMTLTFDLWPWKPFQQFPPLTGWICVPSFIEIPSLNTEISHHAKLVLTDGRTENVMPPSPIVRGGGIKTTKYSSAGKHEISGKNHVFNLSPGATPQTTLRSSLQRWVLLFDARVANYCIESTNQPRLKLSILDGMRHGNRL